MTKRAKPSQSVTALVRAAKAAWDAFVRYGPVDDGRPQGEAFDQALDALMKATHEVKYDPASGFCDTITFYVQCRRTPGGRGRNAVHYVGWSSDRSRLDEARGNSEQLVLGKLLDRHHTSGKPPARVVVEWVQAERPAKGEADEEVSGV
jgi:hypothetical protein